MTELASQIVNNIATDETVSLEHVENGIVVKRKRFIGVNVIHASRFVPIGVNEESELVLALIATADELRKP